MQSEVAHIVEFGLKIGPAFIAIVVISVPDRLVDIVLVPRLVRTRIMPGRAVNVASGSRYECRITRILAVTFRVGTHLAVNPAAVVGVVREHSFNT
ncbi:hypothetical protein D3C87_1917780 [compost metagenome]